MDYATAILGKNLQSLTYADLEVYFAAEREESDQVEFKAYVNTGSIESKLSGLIRSIAAFLNSDGGLLIWGAPLGEKKLVGDRKVAVFKGSLTDLPAELSDKDWIISKIVDKIIPLPAGIRVQTVKQNDSSVAVFEIDRSTYSPHQTDERYFMRLDGQTRTAPHHYIEALFSRVSYPQLETYLKIERISTDREGFAIHGAFYFTNKSMQNEELFSAEIQLFGGEFSNGDSFRNYIQPGCLFYGQWVRNSFRMRFKTQELDKFDYLGRIIVFFGGKTAPRKVCEYELNFNSISLSNPEKSIIIKIENKLQSEIIFEKNISDEEMLKDIGVIRNLK